jgi:hypothetical protein
MAYMEGNVAISAGKNKATITWLESLLVLDMTIISAYLFFGKHLQERAHLLFYVKPQGSQLNLLYILANHISGPT